jgi:hypothetical protein
MKSGETALKNSTKELAISTISQTIKVKNAKAATVKGYQARRRSCRKAETQYGKIHYVPQPPLSACQVTLAVCGRKETQPLAALDNKQKISLSLM